MSTPESSHNGPTFAGGAHIASRVCAALFGSYVFVWGVITLGIALCVAAGLPYDDARTLSYLLCFLVFVAAFCWAFTERSLRRVWLTLAGGGGAMTLAGWLLAKSLN